MKLKGLILLFFIGFTKLFYAQGNVTEFPMEESSLLWKISGKNVKSDAYLFGTMHLIEKDYFIFPKKLQKVVKKSDALVMELEGLPNQAEAIGYVMLKEGSFFDYFSPEQTDTILRWAKAKFGMEEATFRSSFSNMKPFAVTQLAVQLHFIGKTESYELSFEELAKAADIEIIGLETIAEQMSLFDNLTPEQQTEMVMESIRTGEKSIELVKKMQTVYQSQEIDQLYSLILEEGGVIQEEQANFLDNRNKKWIPQIEQIISTKNTFIAVGAGHLGGPNGVIRLLEKEGYTLTPIKL
jgi:uncharacterized protein YbaP (TraB family)